MNGDLVYSEKASYYGYYIRICRQSTVREHLRWGPGRHLGQYENTGDVD